jgi:alkanesulfonate monooxygenase SsuD/methylene tetrahydromethanopterin reductase-like flavin-dependent oxidoreductase (luciferase family)
MASTPFKAGVLVWNQYTTWADMRQAALDADRLGYDSLWTWDHLYPILGDPNGPFLEAYTILGAWSQLTTKPTIGLLVGANTFRNPAIVAKMVTTLDHLSGGRAVLGLGAAWFDTEHEAFGIDFGASVGERLNRLDEAVELLRAMLPGGPASARGVVYHAKDVRNDPPPVQARLPILIGGGGEKKTLQTVARYADAWNVSMVTPPQAAEKNAILDRWCEEVGRDPSEIERTISLGPILIRDDAAEGEKARAALQAANPEIKREIIVMSGAQMTEHVQAFYDAGFPHAIFHLGMPYDAETLERFVTEVKPAIG